MLKITWEIKGKNKKLISTFKRKVVETFGPEINEDTKSKAILTLLKSYEKHSLNYYLCLLKKTPNENIIILKIEH